MAFNIVELAASEENADTAFDQRCRFGHRVEGHAVYCHNDAWEDSPRKCRRSWYTEGRITDESCAGFDANPAFKGELVSITPPSVPCRKCRGLKRVATDRGRSATCPLCVGSGCQPTSIALTQYEQDALESGTTHTGRHDTAGHPFVYIAANGREGRSIDKLCGLGLVVLRSMSFVHGTEAVAYLLENTMKGEAVMRENWKTKRKKP